MLFNSITFLLFFPTVCVLYFCIPSSQLSNGFHERRKISQCIVLEVLTWLFLSMKLVSLMLIAIYNLPIKRLSEFPVIEEYTRQGWWIAYLIVGVAIPVVWTYYYHLLKDRLTKCSSDFV